MYTSELKGFVMGATAKQKVDLSKYSRELTEFEEQTLFELFQGKKNLVIAHDTGPQFLP